MKYIALGLLLAGLAVPVLAQVTPPAATNPYTTVKVAYWDVVTQFRTAYRITLVAGFGREDLAKFALLFSDRVMASLWDGLARRVTTLRELLTLKNVGPSVAAKIALFHSFTDEADARALLGIMD